METTGIVLWVGSVGSALIVCADGKELAYTANLNAACLAGSLPREGDLVRLRLVDESVLRRCDNVIVLRRNARPDVREAVTSRKAMNQPNLRAVV